MKKVLIVGGGITSALTGYLLRQKLLTDLIHITVWDKAKGPGGRMSTSRSNKVPNCTVDLGLQYITTTPELQQEHSDIYQPLLNEKLIEPLKANIIGYKSKRTNVVHYVTPEGSSSVVKYFLNQSNIDEIHYNTFLQTLQGAGSSNKVEAITKDGKSEQFDVVVLSIPAPQMAQLIDRSVPMFVNDSREYRSFRKVVYSARYAYGLFFDENFEKPFDVKYFDNDDMIRYISFDNVKRNRPDKPVGVCVHTTEEFFRIHCDSHVEDQCSIEMALLKRLREMFPTWPLPADTKLQKWLFSQVKYPHEETIGYSIYNVNPLVLCVGDSYVSQSNFDSCIYSVKQGVELLLKEIRS